MQEPAMAGSTNTVVQTISVTAAATGVHDFRFVRLFPHQGGRRRRGLLPVRGLLRRRPQLGNPLLPQVPNRVSSRVSLYPVLLSRPADDDGRVHASFACTLLDKSGKPASPESKDTADSAHTHSAPAPGRRLV
ncbi:unknown protein [Oryza sativa Japonica Group]|uniref:Os01g0355400 protein n=2 Tax=Oryza sativa subsp. japonica TaxID=39947 RepID=Q5ZDQ6_ORYSJ|nr:unknown protein [Oryza sativa Japonica Group]BAD52752.1 unknown protein [Oryza sativa Japonica Group]BAF04909.1 Os01g0355400 [Oryza sativa Japonica Group]BAG89122.1 unnamed protein product [Oryza sativa Japonica Group]BAG98197.1 unnamed protein product [Oryza sativa Japonica Group]|eukprot:NP_001042995.1 Os01g0355400 [Oryza sativa Japonica Group]